MSNTLMGRIEDSSTVLRSNTVFLDSSMVEHTAVNRGVVGSSPTRGVSCFQEKRKYDRLDVRETDKCSCVEQKYGPLVKRLRHRPFTAVTRVRFPYGSLLILISSLLLILTSC